MHPEAAFLAGYALVLVAVSAGLASLGRRSTHPQASRMLAAGRPPDARPPGNEKADWPHSEVPMFHLGVSEVVLAAALLLTAASIARHHRPIELVVQLALFTLIATRIARAVARHRALAPAQRDSRRTVEMARTALPPRPDATEDEPAPEGTITG